MLNKDCGFGTKAIHAGNVKDTQYGALTTPIFQTSTFVFDSCEQGGRRFAGEEAGYIYTRLSNPTTSVLEAKVAALESGEACVAAASGMGAISSALWTVAGAGKHIVADGTLYGCTFALLNHGMTRYGVEVSFVDTSDLDAVRKALKPNTCAVYLETPANPNLKIADISAVAALAHGYNKDIKVICDNTFASPYLQRPLELGADVVVHSATKYLNGHGDVIAGFVVGSAEFCNEVRMFGLKDMTGAVMDPFCAFLILRGLKTLDLRVKRHSANALKVAEWLESQPSDVIERVWYPGLESHPGHEIAARQMHGGFGGIVSVQLAAGAEAAKHFVDHTQIFTLAESLGGVESLIEVPAAMTHASVAGTTLQVPANLVRISVGIENADDLIADLKQALDRI